MSVDRQTVVSVGVHFSEYDQCSVDLFCDVLVPNMNMRLKLMVEQAEFPSRQTVVIKE